MPMVRLHMTAIGPYAERIRGVTTGSLRIADLSPAARWWLQAIRPPLCFKAHPCVARGRVTVLPGWTLPTQTAVSPQSAHAYLLPGTGGRRSLMSGSRSPPPTTRLSGDLQGSRRHARRRGARLERLREGFPTTVLAALRSRIASWRELGPGDATLIHFVVPRKL